MLAKKKKVALLNSPSKSHVKFRYILTASSALQKQMQAIIKTFFLFHLINPSKTNLPLLTAITALQAVQQT